MPEQIGGALTTARLWGLEAVRAEGRIRDGFCTHYGVDVNNTGARTLCAGLSGEGDGVLVGEWG